MAGIDGHAEEYKAGDESQLPATILDVSQNKWQDGSQPFEIPEGVTKFRLEFSCFVDDDSVDLDVDISALTFNAKGSYFETIGYGCPISTDRGVVHEHDSVQPEAGKISEDMDFDLTLLHKRVYAICFVATTYGKQTFANARSIQLRILASSNLSSESLEKETARVVYTQEGFLGQADDTDPNTSPPNVLVLGDLRRILPRTASDAEGAGPRVGAGRERWDFRAPNVIGAVIGAPPEAVPIVQGYLREWIPSVEIVGEELLVRRVYDIVSLLPPEDLEALRRAWAGAGTLGVTKDLFLGNMLRVLLRAHMNLRDERQRVELTSLLSDLFDQISGVKRCLYYH